MGARWIIAGKHDEAPPPEAARRPVPPFSALAAACAEAMAEGVHSSDVIINILTRHRDPGPPAIILTPEALMLRHTPVADCARYDQLRSR